MRRANARNAVRQVVVDFVGDPFGARTALAFGGWDTRAKQGTLSQAIVGEHGDPTISFGGVIAQPVQHFTGAAGNRLQYRDGENTIDKNLSDEALMDPARRIFADRLRRRR